METIREHLEKAAHNAAFLAAFSTSNFPDWAIVALFYRALHVTSAVIHTNGDDHGGSHGYRQRAVRRHFSREAAIAYEQIYSRSRLLRYEEIATDEAEYHALLEEGFALILREARAVLPEL